MCLGNFGKTVITLSYNRLSRLESSIFKPILEQMESTDQYGYVDIYESTTLAATTTSYLNSFNNNINIISFYSCVKFKIPSNVIATWTGYSLITVI